MKKYFVTRWALSTGVREVQGEVTAYGDIRGDGMYSPLSLAECFEQEVDARAKVLGMARAKVESLAKQTAKLEKLIAKFEAGGALPMQKKRAGEA